MAEDKTDATGLTANEKMTIQDVWKPVGQDPRTSGVFLIKELFTMYPETQKLFSDFKDHTLSEIDVSPVARAHGIRVIHAFTSIVENLYDVDVLVTLLQKTAHGHYQRGIRYHHFQALKLVVLSVLEKALGNKFGVEERRCWDKGLDVINAVIKKTLDQEENKAKGLGGKL